MSFLRHREIYQVETGGRGRNRGYARASRLDESPVGYSLAGCSPAEPASASPTGGTLQQWRRALQLAIRCYLKTTLTRGLTLGAHPKSEPSELNCLPSKSFITDPGTSKAKTAKP
jgi:hypothetical protein